MRGGGGGRHRRPRLGLPAHSPRGAAVCCFLCTFDKWLHFYILIANRNNTPEALERPQVPAQTGDERVSNERERQLQGIKRRECLGEVSECGDPRKAFS